MYNLISNYSSNLQKGHSTEFFKFSPQTDIYWIQNFFRKAIQLYFEKESIYPLTIFVKNDPS